MVPSVIFWAKWRYSLVGLHRIWDGVWSRSGAHPPIESIPVCLRRTFFFCMIPYILYLQNLGTLFVFARSSLHLCNPKYWDIINAICKYKNAQLSARYRRITKLLYMSSLYRTFHRARKLPTPTSWILAPRPHRALPKYNQTLRIAFDLLCTTVPTLPQYNLGGWEQPFKRGNSTIDTSFQAVIYSLDFISQREPGNGLPTYSIPSL